MPKRRTKPGLDRKTYGYCRVSTDEQAIHGVSLEMQEESIRAFAATKGWVIDEMIIDAGKSAKDLKRPGMLKLLDALEAGTVDNLLVLKFDRLTRRLGDLCNIMDRCVTDDVVLVSVADGLDATTAQGRMMMQLMGTFAEFERSLIAGRTRDALAHKRAAGRVYGPTPFGYRRVGSNLIEVPEEQAAIALALQHRDRKGWSYDRIGAWLTSQNMMPRRAKAWSRASVRKMMNRTSLSGLAGPFTA